MGGVDTTLRYSQRVLLKAMKHGSFDVVGSDSLSSAHRCLSIFDEKTAVDATDCRRQKNGHFFSEINAVDVSTGKTSEMAPSVPDCVGDSLDIPSFLQVANRKVPYHPDRQCPLGPGGEGDSLDDLK